MGESKNNCVCVCAHTRTHEKRGRGQGGKWKKDQNPRNMRNYGRKSWYYCQLKDASLTQNKLSYFKFHNSFVKVGSNKKTVTDLPLSLNHCKWRESRFPSCFHREKVNLNLRIIHNQKISC